MRKQLLFIHIPITVLAVLLFALFISTSTTSSTLVTTAENGVSWRQVSLEATAQAISSRKNSPALQTSEALPIDTLQDSLIKNILRLEQGDLSKRKTNRIHKRVEADLTARQLAAPYLLLEAPKQSQGFLLEQKIVDLVPDSLRHLVETEVTFEDILIQPYHIDSFENMKSEQPSLEQRYFASIDGETYKFLPRQDISEFIEFRTAISGIQLGSTIIGDITGQITRSEGAVRQRAQAANRSGASSPNSTEYKTAVLLVTYLSSPPVPFSSTEAHALVFEGPFQRYLQENSYGRAEFTGDIYGWIGIEDHTGVCDYFTESSSPILSTFAAQGVDFAEYDHVLILENCHIQNTTGGYSSVGAWNVVIEGTDYQASFAKIRFNGDNIHDTSYWTQQGLGKVGPWSNLDFLLTHELGHSFGNWHANAYLCDDMAIGPELECRHREYGNMFDHLGSGVSAATHFNGLYKDIFGWINPSERLVVSNPGRYTISNLEEPGGKKYAQIRDQQGTTILYTVEFREPIGFDNPLSHRNLRTNVDGIFINRVRYPFSADYPELSGLTTQIIDADLVDHGTHHDWRRLNTSLKPTQVFEDLDRGIRISNVEIVPDPNTGKNLASFEVEYIPAQCQELEPGLTDDSPFYIREIQPGVPMPMLGIENRDSIHCPDSDMLLEIEFPTEFNLPSYESGSISVEPQEEQYFYDLRNLTIPYGLDTGSYVTEATITNLRTGLDRDYALQWNIEALPTAHNPGSD